MTAFSEIYQRAIDRKGTRRDVNALLHTPSSPARLRRIADDRWLACMTHHVFQSGFNSTAVTLRWGNFEQAFAGFDPERWADMGKRDVSRLMRDDGIVRNQTKIESVKQNARLLLSLADEFGSASRGFAAWPGSQIDGLLELMRTEGCRLGGITGQRVLRNMGKDTYMLTPDVLTGLSACGITVTPSRRAMARVQGCFNTWQSETGLPLCQLSAILALSCGFNHCVTDIQRWRGL